MLPKCVHTFSSHLLIFIHGCLKNFVGFALSLLHSQSCCFLQTEMYPFHSLPTPFSLTLLVSILISRGWRTMQPATFHPSVFHSFIPFRLLSFRKLFLSALLPHHLTSNSFFPLLFRELGCSKSSL